MKTFIKHTLTVMALITVASCSSGGSSSGGGGNTPIPNATGVNLGNITTIPLNGNSSNTILIATNNTSANLVLTDSTYTIYSGSDILTPLPTSGGNSPVDTSQCTMIVSHQVCNISVRAPIKSGSGQYEVNMSFKNPANNQIYKTSQIVSYSDSIPAVDGVIYSTINTNVYNEVNGSTTVSVPFVLTKSFTSLTAITENDNPAFAPTISCPGNSYESGNLCTLKIAISGTGTSPVVSGNILVKEPTTQTTKLQNSGKTLQGATGYLFNVPVTVTSNNVGNLVTSGSNVTINPADGLVANAQVVTLLNNGSAAISTISITGGSPLALIAPASGTDCRNLASLASGLSCSFRVNVNPAQTTSGQSAVTVNYLTTSGGTSNSLSFNVVYIATAAGPAMTMTSGQGSLNNVQINTTQYFNLIVSNTGNVALSNITFNNVSVAGLSYDPTSTCLPNGTQGLAVGATCTLVLQYSPTITATGTVTINASARYTDASGNPNQTYGTISAVISYSAITSPAFIYISPNYTSFAIRADNTDTATQSFTVYNAGSISATNVTITLPTVTGGFTNLGPGTSCTVGSAFTLASNSSCTVNTQYGPTLTTLATTAFGANQIQAAYTPFTGGATVTAFSNLVFTSSAAALVRVSNIAFTGTGVTGNGLIATPYLFNNTPTPGTQIQFTITYSNTGTSNATNFNVGLNNLPVGYGIVSGTCGYGSSTSTLASPAGTCNVVIRAIEATQLSNPYNFSGVLNFGIPGFSYTDTNTGLNTTAAPIWTGNFANGNTIYVNATNVLTATPANPTTWATGASGGTNNYTFTGSASSGALVIYIPITSLAGGLFTVGNSRTCTLATTSPYQCTISITNPAALAPSYPATYNFGFKVLPVGTVSPTDSTAGSTLQASFNYAS